MPGKVCPGHRAAALEAAGAGDAEAVGFVDEQHGVVLLCQCQQVGERRFVAQDAVEGFDGDHARGSGRPASSRTASSTLLWAKDSVRERLSRNPSIIEAWQCSSATIRVPGPPSAVITPMLAR